MNRTDRLFAIVLELQNGGVRRADDLAAKFEISKRTVYRDIQALSETGVPVVATPGTGYSLMEGYFLPPLSFTTDEATMLLLGSDFVAKSFDSQYSEAAASASQKINAVLSKKLRDEVDYLQSAITFVAGDLPDWPRRSEMLTSLRRAIIDRKRVRFLYHTRYPQNGQSAKNLREADPHRLAFFFGVWYVIAHCHLRNDIRYFRLDRMADLEVLKQTFERPKNSERHRRHDDAGRNVVIRVVFEQEAAAWVREWPSYYVVAMEDTSDGLLVSLRVRSEDEVVQWLLGWGGAVRILEPETLRQRFNREAAKMLQNHGLKLSAGRY